MTATVAIVREDMVIGRGTGCVGVPLPDDLVSLPLERLRFDGFCVVDTADVSLWYVDTSGAKRLRPGEGRQPLLCQWNDRLVNIAGAWRVADKHAESLKAYAARKREAAIDAKFGSAGFLSVAMDAVHFMQDAFDVERACIDRINAGSITTTAEIDAAPWPAN